MRKEFSGEKKFFMKNHVIVFYCFSFLSMFIGIYRYYDFYWFAIYRRIVIIEEFQFITIIIFSSYNLLKHVRYHAIISRQPGVITQFR